METNLQIIRKACIEANPEIMELKFGCDIAVGNDRGYIHYSMYDKDGPTLLGFVSTSDPKKLRPIQWKKGDPIGYTILGRPIRLADVLLAIKSSPKCDTYWEYGATSDIVWGNPPLKNNAWNLRNDDLITQSPDTLQFLADLLTNK